MNGDQFFDLAARLSTSANEVDLRTSVSRSYYGAFHAAREFVEACGVRFARSDGGVHTHVKRCLDQSQSDDLVFAADQLNSLRSDRNDADYDLKSTKFQRPMNAAVRLTVARAIAAAMQKSSGELTFSKIRDEILSYARDVLRLTVID
ncbi:MAG TPA: hypothetical protein VND64_27360 [Pirellulales bacterium]|nr:hypothetical protein [Pirellulales bacterium]